MDGERVRADVREILAVVAMAGAGLVLAAVVAFTPWYSPVATDAAVIELRGPVVPAGTEAQR